MTTSTLTDRQLCDHLYAVVPALPEKDREFAMIRKKAPGLYQIGIYDLTKTKHGWEAFPSSLMSAYRRHFPSIAAAYLNLTGEPMDKRLFAGISRSKT